MSLFFNMLSRLDIAFLTRSKHLLISCLQSLSAVILESKKIKSLSVSTVSPSICHEVMDGETMETVRGFILGAPKSLQSPSAACIGSRALYH